MTARSVELVTLKEKYHECRTGNGKLQGHYT